MTAQPTDARSTRSLGARFLDLGISRVSALGARALMFLAFGLSLQPSDYGRVAVALSTAMLFSVVFDAGVPLLLLRSGATRGDDENAQAIPGLVLLRMLLLLPLLTLYVLSARLLSGSGASLSLLLSIGLYVLCQSLAQTVFVFLRGSRRTSVEGFTTLGLSLVEVLLVAVWHVAARSDPAPLFMALAVARGLSVFGLVLWCKIRLEAPVDLGTTWRFLMRHASDLKLYSLLAFCQFGLTQADTLLLQAFRPADEVGRYYACMRTVWLFYLPNELLLAASMPRLASAANRPQAFRSALFGLHRLTALWVSVVVVAVVGETEFIGTTLLGPELSSATSLLAFTVIGAAISWLPPFALPFSMGRAVVPATRAYAVGALSSIVAQLLLIPRFGAYGAACACAFGYLMLKLATLPVASLKNRFEWFDRTTLLPPLALALAWALLAHLLRPPAWVGLSALLLFAGAAFVHAGRKNLALIEHGDHDDP